MDSISQYCGETLYELSICGNGDYIVKIRSPFTALIDLRLGSIITENFDPTLMLPEMENLILNRVKNMDWIANKFAKLKHIYLNYLDLSDDTFIEFQNRNPQLKSLFLQACPNLTSTVFDNIDARLPNINLILVSCTKFGDSIHHFRNLRCLTKLHLLNCHVANPH